MATDPQSLVSQGKCYTCFGGNTESSMQLALLAQIVNASPTPPSSDNFRITEAGDFRITQTGDNRIIQ